jgi:hypothetical protein
MMMKAMMMVMMMVMMMIMVGDVWSQSTDDGFTEDILESSDVSIKSKLLSLSTSQVICWSCSDFRLNAVG